MMIFNGHHGFLNPSVQVGRNSQMHTIWRYTTLGTSIGFRQDDGLDLTATKFNEESSEQRHGTVLASQGPVCCLSCHP